MFRELRNGSDSFVELAELQSQLEEADARLQAVDHRNGNALALLPRNDRVVGEGQAPIRSAIRC